VTFASRNHSLVVDTSKCGWAITLRARPMTSCTCICIHERKVGSIWNAEAYAGKSANHACIMACLDYILAWLHPESGRLIQMANSMHKSTLCKENVISYFHFHPNLVLTGTTELASWICICIADKKIHTDVDPRPLGLP
jgi:hypothetical protein